MRMDLSKIEQRLNYTFKDKAMLTLALTHRSYWNENKSSSVGHNERLEFLGDSVLGLIIGEYLYRNHPDLEEGDLSNLRSNLVEAEMCIAYIYKLGLEGALLLGKGEMMNRGKGRETILSDLLEALMAAIYLDGGYKAAYDFFFFHFEEEVKKMIALPSRNPKAELQDYAQRKYQEAPIYQVIDEWGPPHAKKFKVAVFIKNEKVGEGEGGSKKEAQTSAAQNAVSKLL